jgi:hypothetical protein
VPQHNFKNSYQFSKPGTEDAARIRKAAIDAIREEYGEVTFYDSKTVIAGGIKHEVPEGATYTSAPSEGKVGPRGGVYREWYSPGSDKSYREYYPR